MLRILMLNPDKYHVSTLVLHPRQLFGAFAILCVDQDVYMRRT